jgi:hypothetical protein
VLYTLLRCFFNFKATSTFGLSTSLRMGMHGLTLSNDGMRRSHASVPACMKMSLIPDTSLSLDVASTRSVPPSAQGTYFVAGYDEQHLPLQQAGWLSPVVIISLSLFHLFHSHTYSSSFLTTLAAARASAAHRRLHSLPSSSPLTPLPHLTTWLSNIPSLSSSLPPSRPPALLANYSLTCVVATS